MASIRNTTAEQTGDTALLDAARASILAVGWRRSTLTDVARRAGVSRMTIYRRWPDMQTLLADLLVREWGGLVDRVRASTLDEARVEDILLDFLAPLVPAGKSPMCGNTIGQDRRFMVKYMPRLEAYFHYRNLDVSTLKELSLRWKPEVYHSFTKAGKHEALADVQESIDELKHYREHFLKL